MIGYDLLILAFTTGMVVTVNPCGFAMLPAYLSFFLGAETPGQPPLRDVVGRALIIGAAMTAGFVSTFAVAGLSVTLLSDTFYRVAPWVSVVIGVALASMGVVLLVGREITARLPHLDRGGRTTGVGSMALFGVSYAIASCGCALPLFVATTSTVFGRGFGQGVQYFAAYSVGFGLVVTTLTMALAVGRQSVVARVRRVLPYVNRIAGGLLIATGVYIAYYGTIEVRSGQNRGVVQNPIVDRVTSWSTEASNWIAEQGGERLGSLLMLILLFGVAVAYRARGPRDVGPTTVRFDDDS